MERNCASCGDSFTTARGSARFCSDRCRKRGQRGHLRSVEAAPDVPAAEAPAASDSLTSITRAALVEVRRDATPLGRSALVLAARIDAGQDTGSGLASLNREWRATLEAATANARTAANPVDQLQQVRIRRLGAG